MVILSGKSLCDGRGDLFELPPQVVESGGVYLAGHTGSQQR